MKKITRYLCILCILSVLAYAGNFLRQHIILPKSPTISLENIPKFSGEPYVVLEDNVPQFTENDYTNESYEFYSELDRYNRCGYTMACIGQDIMPNEERGSIGQIKPTGWQTVKYDFVDGKYLYNRCHLIGYQLTGENDNERNLITGTRYMNVEGMLPFENMVADYVEESGNHVLYRVTPVFDGNDMVAKGVVMEALSMEDDGAGISFHVFIYNNQPGVMINYSTGESVETEENEQQTTVEKTYILNINSKKFHNDDCKQVQSIKEKNRKTYRGNQEKLISNGYEPAGCCNP